MAKEDEKPPSSQASHDQLDSEKIGASELVQLSEQGIKKDIGAFRIIAVGFNIPNSWLALGTAFTTAAAAGGLFISALVYGMAAVTLAELASVYPTAGGQYHFVSVLAPKRFNKSLSYACGVIATVSFIAGAASCCSVVSTSLWAFAAHYTGYVPESWHLFLMYQAANAFATMYNLFLLKRTNWIHDAAFLFSLASFLTISITCLVTADKQPSQKVWTDFEPNTGWTPFMSFVTGLPTFGYMYGCLDSALHLAEETHNAAVVVPRALMAVIALGFTSAFIFAISMSYAITDLPSLLAEPMPIYKLWRDATKSDAAGTVFTVILTLIMLFIVIAVIQTTSRLIWALARDNGLLFSPVFLKLEPRLGNVPANAILLSSFFIFVCGCISLGSSAAFNAFVGSFLILQFVSFAMPAALLVYQRRDPALLPPTRSFKVPEVVGWICNIGTCVAAVLELVFFTFPAQLPVTGTSMNYASVVLAVVALISVANWFLYAKKHYQGPRMEFYL
ncbi:Choline transport protein [Cladobotryum mycophilum]|uniref:Choline transport protein n=1 Tax=Cladobotryum mycophilum TaxID=491253 RepID=A0ABR0S6T4_9HYPO